MRYADTLLTDGEVIMLRRRQHWLALLVEGRAAVALWLIAIALLAAVWFFDLQGQPAQWVGVAALTSLVIGAVLFGIRYWQWWAQDFIVTNRRLLKVTGVFNKRSSSSALEKINDAILDHNLVGRIMNFGDIDILTASGELAVDYFRMLNGAKEFKRVLTNQKHALEMEYRWDQTPSPPMRASMNIIGEPANPPPAEPAPRALEPAPEPEPEPEPQPPAQPELPAEPAPVTEPAPAAEPADKSLEITRTLARLADLRDQGAISAEEYEAKKDELLRRL
jgi:hypothetical protein